MVREKVAFHMASIGMHVFGSKYFKYVGGNVSDQQNIRIVLGGHIGNSECVNTFSRNDTT